MNLSEMTDTDRKAVADTVAICNSLLAHAAAWQARGNLDTSFLARFLEYTISSVYRLCRDIADARPAKHCYAKMDLMWDDTDYAFMAELLRPMGVGLAEVLIMTNPSPEGIHTLDDMRAFCERVQMNFPYTHSILMYPAGNLEAIVVDMKNPEISSDIEVVTVWTP